MEPGNQLPFGVMLATLREREARTIMFKVGTILMALT
jgi:hypothetical protein